MAPIEEREDLRHRKNPALQQENKEHDCFEGLTAKIVQYASKQHRGDEAESERPDDGVETGHKCSKCQSKCGKFFKPFHENKDNEDQKCSHEYCTGCVERMCSEGGTLTRDGKLKCKHCDFETTADYCRELLGHKTNARQEIDLTLSNACKCCDMPLEEKESCGKNFKYPGDCKRCKATYCHFCKSFVSESDVPNKQLRDDIVTEHILKNHPEERRLELDMEGARNVIDSSIFASLKRCKKVYLSSDLFSAFEEDEGRRNQFERLCDNLEKSLTWNSMFCDYQPAHEEEDEEDAYETSEKMVLRFLFPQLSLKEFAYNTLLKGKKWTEAMLKIKDELGGVPGIAGISASGLVTTAAAAFGFNVSVGSAVFLGAGVAGLIGALVLLFKTAAKKSRFCKAETQKNEERGAGLARGDMVSGKPERMFPNKKIRFVDMFKYVWDSLVHFCKKCKASVQTWRSGGRNQNIDNRLPSEEYREHAK
eukprot:CAMPEP_0113892282 /NCGR_PEP_ID=MMETSP0780_2-20120614/15317_1 /TAXON_ID=652834 /ORGANISM="Palpitomonas bilix" /LENGTH=478 /DNA_ID=CAMNT_0000882177 /DNA_START=187 /DNA_END=1623 /DNA_ORIENTATION=+ /assembly_acc=CAM_ASM_000599